MAKQLQVLLFFVASFSYAATFTTTGVPGTWSPAGPPGSNDDIIINHDWSGYDAAQIANYTGTMTINSGGYYKMAGSFTNFTGTIDIQSGGTFEVTGAVTVAAGSSTNVDGHWEVGGDLENNQSTNWTGSGTLNVNGIFTDNGNINTVTLPVELVQFSVEEINGNAHIFWQTASEINNDYFSIERSIDGINFEEINIVDGNGNSFFILDYHYIDNKLPNASNIYYRLRQVDFDGSFEYSPIISLNNKIKLEIIQFGQSNEVQIITGSEGQMTATIYSLSGQISNSESNYVSEGSITNLVIPGSGIYVVSATLGNLQITKKIYVQ